LQYDVITDLGLTTKWNYHEGSYLMQKKPNKAYKSFKEMIKDNGLLIDYDLRFGNEKI